MRVMTVVMWLIVLIIGVLLLIGLALTDTWAAQNQGNLDGCGMQGVDWCTVTNSGRIGWNRYFVSLACDFYAVPSSINTSIRWRVGTRVELWGCIALDREGRPYRLAAPFTIRRR